jgi:hypothetical protein
MLSSSLLTQAPILVHGFSVMLPQFLQGYQHRNLVVLLERKPVALKTGEVQVQTWH